MRFHYLSHLMYVQKPPTNSHVDVSNNDRVVGRICNNFEKKRAFYDKSMKLGTWLVDNKTKKKIRVSATPKMPSNGRHLVFPKWPPFFNLFIIISLFICKRHVFFS